ncbi:DUF6126 family protein [Streptomyces sp. NPDC056835]
MSSTSGAATRTPGRAGKPPSDESVFATHALAGFIRLLFYVGEHAPK